ncbi:MAG: flagellar basal-body MS-ring/collar protein FliF [Gammaproteobacteria bacterium]
MDSVTVQNPVTTAQSMLSNPAVRQLLTMVGIAASVALGVLVIMWTQSPDYNLLYANLDDEQTSEIVQSLEAAGIPYKLQNGGVTVPAESVHEARMKLAGEGLPSSSGNGLDMLQDEPGFGVSQFLEVKRYNHGLETAIGRTIEQLKPVKSARVHIAVAKDSVFVRNRSETTASVMLDVRSGQRLEKEQVGAIVFFLARSVNGLEADNVTVVDQSGRMLNSPDSSSDHANSANQFEHTKRVEDAFVERIEDILSPIVGAGKVRAQVVASLDFTKSEETKEVYDPDRSVVRSESTRFKERRGDAGGAEGIPGALTNQPPVGGNEEANNPEDVNPIDSSRDAVRNFEVDRTISHTVQASGGIRRLSVAVIVDDRQSLDEEGNIINTPRTEAEVQQLNALVREAVGFDEARGDTIQVINSSFETMDMGEPPVDPKIWETPMFRDLLKQGLGVLLVLTLFFGALRPMSRSLIQAANAPQLAYAGAAGADGTASGRMLAVEDSDEVTTLPDSEPKEVPMEMRIDNARKLASENPETVANVVKTWVAEDG